MSSSSAPVVIGRWRAMPARPDAILINIATRTLTRGNRIVSLPPVCFRLAMLLLASAGRLVGRDELMQAAYGERADGGPEVNTVHVLLSRRVRMALCEIGVEIQTAFSLGFRVIIHPVGAPVPLTPPRGGTAVRRAA